MRTQVQKIASRGFAVLRRLRSIRRYVPTSVFQSLVSAFVLNRLDNCNSLLVDLGQPASTPPVGLEFCGATHLQTASLGAHHQRTDEPTMAACPGTCRVQSRRAHVQGFKRPRAAEAYLSSAFTHVVDMPSRRRHGSASTDQLLVPSYRPSTIGRRAFAIAGARVWNGLTSDVTSAPSLAVFGRRLKTELFRRC